MDVSKILSTLVTQSSLFLKIATSFYKDGNLANCFHLRNCNVRIFMPMLFMHNWVLCDEVFCVPPHLLLC